MTPFVRYALAASLSIGLHLVARTSAAAIPEDRIDRAVERGVAALRTLQAEDGSFSGTIHGSGPTSLAALTLLECGATSADVQVRKAVAFVRKDCPTLNRTYNLAMAIILLDRMGDPLDEPIIHALAVRLLEGQNAIGAWGYTAPDVPGEETARLRTLIDRRAELKTVPGPTPPAPAPVAPEIIDRLGRLEQRRTTQDIGGFVDNSNTQFALLGLWVGRRHGIPTDAALKRAELYFRATQDGGRWPYRPRQQVDEQRPANTCSGLLSLAIGAGMVREAQLRTHLDRKNGKPPALRDPFKDPLVQIALNYVGSKVVDAAVTGLNSDANWHRGLYFLWSVERVGMIYSLPVMGGVNWYQTGAAAILRAQLPNGTWTARTVGPLHTPADVNTCFALLFLRKANFAHDLTANLKIRLKDTTLRSGDEKSDALPPPAAEPTDAERLARELLGASPGRQEAIIAELRDGKGTDFTAALAKSIPTLAGVIQKKARDALAERLARLTVATIRTKLKDDDAEVRRAATLACAMKEDKAFIPDLIGVLDDKDNWVVRSSAVALRTLTGQDFGPSASATAEERAKAVAAWKAWWTRQNRG
jgi:hypothetical protein